MAKAASAQQRCTDPAEGTWFPAGSMQQSRHSHTATMLSDGRVLVLGGQGYAGEAWPRQKCTILLKAPGLPLEIRCRRVTTTQLRF